MDCQLIEERLSNFHFGVVEAGERTAIENHLAGCAGCLRELFVFKAAVEEGERSSLVPSVRLPPARVSHYGRAAMAAALLLALAGGAEWFLRGKPPAPERVATFDTADTGEARLATYHIF